jgi:hypothetical protein
MIPTTDIRARPMALAEFGDDRERYADARKNYAGTSPITRAAGTRRVAGTTATNTSVTPGTNGRSAR